MLLASGFRKKCKIYYLPITDNFLIEEKRKTNFALEDRFREISFHLKLILRKLRLFLFCLDNFDENLRDQNFDNTPGRLCEKIISLRIANCKQKLRSGHGKMEINSWFSKGKLISSEGEVFPHI